MAAPWPVEIVKVDDEGKCYLMSYCSKPPTKTSFVHGIRSLARFQQMLARNEEAALVSAMADEKIPIFEGVSLQPAANALWSDKIKYASSLQMSGWGIEYPLLRFRDGAWLGDAQRGQEEAAALILRVLAKALFMDPGSLMQKMIPGAEHFWGITLNNNASPENSMHLMQWTVEETDACTTVEVPVYVYSAPIPPAKSVSMRWKVRDAVLHGNGCTASMGFRTPRGYFGIMVQYKGLMFNPGWSPEYFVCHSNLEHVPWDLSGVLSNPNVWKRISADFGRTYVFPVDEVGFRISIRSTVTHPAFHLRIDITRTPSTPSG